jgi:hypothetical protein
MWFDFPFRKVSLKARAAAAAAGVTLTLGADTVDGNRVARYVVQAVAQELKNHNSTIALLKLNNVKI